MLWVGRDLRRAARASEQAMRVFVASPRLHGAVQPRFRSFLFEAAHALLSPASSPSHLRQERTPSDSRSLHCCASATRVRPLGASACSPLAQHSALRLYTLTRHARLLHSYTYHELVLVGRLVTSRRRRRSTCPACAPSPASLPCASSATALLLRRKASAESERQHGRSAQVQTYQTLPTPSLIRLTHLTSRRLRCAAPS